MPQTDSITLTPEQIKYLTEHRPVNVKGYDSPMCKYFKERGCSSMTGIGCVCQSTMFSALMDGMCYMPFAKEFAVDYDYSIDSKMRVVRD